MSHYYHRKSYDIVAYTYMANLLCPACLVLKLPLSCHGLSVEAALDVVAGKQGIDRYDEATYDSERFPKVVFADHLEDDEQCGWCGVTL